MGEKTRLFIEKARNKYGDKYGYDEVEYINNSTKVKILCDKGHYFYQTPANHLYGFRCNVCYVRRKWTKERFIYESELIHGELYDYSLFEYVGANVKGVIVCKRCGKSFEQTPSKHINGKRGCGDCNYREAQEERYSKHLAKKFEGIIQPEEYKLIPLGKNTFSKVSNEDFDKVRSVNWYIAETGYALSTKIGSMHRYLMNPPKELFVDHINRDRLDNRRENLRLATPRENTYNSKPYGIADYKGVTITGGKIIAQLIHEGKSVLSTVVETEEEGARLFDIYALHYQGKFAYLNFPENIEEYKEEIKDIFKHG